jgi:hypothetical protein
MRATGGGGLAISASDVSRQKVKALDHVEPQKTVGELVDEFLTQLNLPTQDPQGHPLTYHARLDRESRHVSASELVGDALETGDTLTIQPIIEAG